MKKEIYVIAGPTASGKTEISLNLAKTIDGEIISADSRQIYRELNIGSGKITSQEMQNIKHYCLDLFYVKKLEDKNYKQPTVFDWYKYATLAIDQIYTKNKIPIVCGGTGFYIDTLIYGLPETSNIEIKTGLRKTLEAKTLTELQSLLKEKNPKIYEKIDIKNERRLIRALEIILSGGEINKKVREKKYNVKWIITNPTREELKQKIKIRLLQRLNLNLSSDYISLTNISKINNSPLVKEIENLINQNVDINWLMSLGLEYKYVTMYILKQINAKEMIENLFIKICQYAKRQITWNKKYAK